MTDSQVWRTAVWAFAYLAGASVGHLIGITLPAVIGQWAFWFNAFGIPLVAELASAALLPTNFRPFRRWFALKIMLLIAASVGRHVLYTRPFVSTTFDEILIVVVILWPMQLWIVAAIEAIAWFGIRRRHARSAAD